MFRCSSNVGRRGGEQPIHLGYYCKRIGTVMHEMMHALGIIHEQSRSDRDKFIKVKFENIKKRKLVVLIVSTFCNLVLMMIF